MIKFLGMSSLLVLLSSANSLIAAVDDAAMIGLLSTATNRSAARAKSHDKKKTHIRKRAIAKAKKAVARAKAALKNSQKLLKKATKNTKKSRKNKVGFDKVKLATATLIHQMVLKGYTAKEAKAFVTVKASCGTVNASNVAIAVPAVVTKKANPLVADLQITGNAPEIVKPQSSGPESARIEAMIQQEQAEERSTRACIEEESLQAQAAVAAESARIEEERLQAQAEAEAVEAPVLTGSLVDIARILPKIGAPINSDLLPQVADKEADYLAQDEQDRHADEKAAYNQLRLHFIENIMRYKSLELESADETQLKKFREFLAEFYSDGMDPDTCMPKEPITDLNAADSAVLERLFRRANNIYTDEAKAAFAIHQGLLITERENREKVILGFTPAPETRYPELSELITPQGSYPVITSYLDAKVGSGALWVNFDQVRREPFFCVTNLPADPAPEWSLIPDLGFGALDAEFTIDGFARYDIGTLNGFGQAHCDPYTAMLFSMLAQVDKFYSSGPINALEMLNLNSRSDAFKAVIQLFTHHGSHDRTGKSTEWRRRVTRVYNSFFTPQKLFIENIPCAELRQLMYNINCIEGARQVLDTMEKRIASPIPVEYQKPAYIISNALMQARDKIARQVAVTIDPTVGTQAETVGHFLISGAYGLSLSKTVEAMDITGLATTRDRRTFHKALDAFFERYTPATMIRAVKDTFQCINRPTDDVNSFLFVDESITTLNSTLKWSNHTYGEILREGFELDGNMNVISIKESTIEDLLVHYDYLTMSYDEIRGHRCC